MVAEELFKEPKNVYEKKLRDVFAAQKDQDPLFKILSLVLYHNSNTTDICDVYKLLGLENFIRLIHLLDGRTVRIPTSSELREAILTAICYYYREVEHLEWSEVKEKIPFEFQSISLSRKIKNLNMAFSKELKTMLTEGDSHEQPVS